MTATSKSTRVLRHPSGIYEVQYCTKALWGLLEFWSEDGLHDDFESAKARADELNSVRTERTQIVYSKD